MARAASAASWAVRATRPGGTGMPASAKSCLAWYSWKFMGTFERSPLAPAGPGGCGREGGALSPGTPVQGKNRRMRPMPPSPTVASSPQHRELYFFALFRTLEAGILGIVAFTPLGQTMADIRAPLILKVAAAVYFLVAALLLWLSRFEELRLRRQAAIGLLLDVMVWGVALLAMDG